MTYVETMTLLLILVAGWGEDLVMSYIHRQWMLFSCFGILREMMSPHWYGSAGKNGGGHYLMRFKIHCHIGLIRLAMVYIKVLKHYFLRQETKRSILLSFNMSFPPMETTLMRVSFQYRWQSSVQTLTTKTSQKGHHTTRSSCFFCEVSLRVNAFSLPKYALLPFSAMRRIRNYLRKAEWLGPKFYSWWVCSRQWT